MKKHPLMSILALFVLPLLLVLVLLGAQAPDAQMPASDPAALGRVAEAILAWDGQNPGDLFKAVKQANPDKSAIVSMRELNKAFADKRMPAPIADNSAAIIQKQKAAQQSVRSKMLAAREATYTRYRSSNPEAFRSVYGNGDIGSWPTAAAPDASMDIDWTVFGTDPNVTAALRDECKADLIRQLAGDDSKLTLADFDIVITAEGHEVAAGVFETEGGIDWAKRNMKIVTIVQPDGATRTYQLGTGNPARDYGKLSAGDPVGEMAQAEHMAKFRDLASKGGDYLELFDKERGFLKEGIFDDPNNTAAQALWNKYMDSLSDFGIDYYLSRSSTATGGCLDMAKHLQEEVITKKHVPQAKLKKTLKYVSRADNISRGVPGLEKILASDPLLSDPAYRDVVDLARKVLGASEAQVNAIIQERFGDMPDAGLQELGNKARRAILRMSEVAFQAEMDRIILETPDQGARKSALDKLNADFRIVAKEGGEYGELSRGAVEQIAKVQDANDAGTIDQIRENYQSLEKIRQADQGLVSSTVEFLKQTELGGKMLEVGGKVLEIGKKPVVNFAEGKYRSASVDFVVEIADATRVKGLTAVQILGSAAMWAEVLDSMRTARSNAALAIALGKTLINNTFFGMVLNSAYAGIVQGDNNALAKAVMYMLVPETALPALVEALGNTAINMGAQMLFDEQMDNVYQASTIKGGKITDFGSLGMAGADGAKYFVDTMCDGAPEEVAQAMIGRSKPSEFGKGLDAFAIKAVATSIRSTVDNGTLLIYKEDGGLARAAAAIRRITEDITDCAKAWGVEIAPFASSARDLPGGLDRGQTRALVKLMEGRERARREARTALVEVIVRTFLERNRAEASLDGGKATDEYNALLKIFEDLGISKEGQASLDAEGAPYTVYTNWKTSEREKQVTAVTAVQRFKDAYTTVLQARSRAEEAARSNLGDGYAFAPRPLTGSLPLTAKPELDLQIAGAYLSEVGKIGQSTVSDLELIKQAKLEGAYDTDMFKRLYDVRLKWAYQLAMMKAASDAQQLHWAVEVFDKQALYNKHSEAAAKASELVKEDMILQAEFRNHYAVQGEFIVDLTGPEQIKSGEEARLVATVKIRPKQGAPGPVPPDIAQQFRYAWRSGKAGLGEGPEPSRSYRLDTVGTHEFTVAVKQTLNQAGKTVEKAIGEKLWTVRVVAPPADPKKPGEKPPAEKPPADAKKPGDKAPGEKPPAEKPPAGTGSIQEEQAPQELITAAYGAGRAAAAVIRRDMKDMYGKYRMPTPRYARNPVLTAAFYRGYDDEWTGKPNVPPKQNDLRSPIKPLTTNNYTAASTATGDEAVQNWIKTAYADGNFIGRMANGEAARADRAKYNSPSPEYKDPQVPSQYASDPMLAKAFLLGYRDGWNMGKYNIPTEKDLGGGESPTRVHIKVIPQQTKLKLGESVQLQAVVNNLLATEKPLMFKWTGDVSGDGDTVGFTATKPGTVTILVSAAGAGGPIGSAKVTFEVGDVEVTVTGAPAGPVVIGTPVKLTANLTAGGEPAKGNYVIRWQPHPEAQFEPFESDKNRDTTVKFAQPGKVRVWAIVLAKEGAILKTLAESDRVEIDVVEPKLTLTASAESPQVGQEVRLTVKDEPTVPDDMISFWWEIKGEALNAGPLQNNREYTYTTKGLQPVTVTVHGKGRKDGSNLGEASKTITPQSYTVQVTGPNRLGPPPMIWSEQAKGLVDAPASAIGTFQDVTMGATINPTPPGQSLRYKWSVSPDGCTLSSPASRETRANASAKGTYQVTVQVSDKNGVVLGSGSGSISVTVSQDDQKPGKKTDKTSTEKDPGKQKEPDKTKSPDKQKNEPNKQNDKDEQAQKFVNEGYALEKQDKLEAAIDKFKQALALVQDRDLTKHISDLETTLDKTKKAQELAAQHLNQALSLGKAGRLDEAAAEVAEAKKDNPSHPKIPEIEQWISQLRQQREAAVNAANQKAAEDKAAEASAREAAAKAAAEAKKAETANQQSVNQAAAQEKLKQANALGQQSKLDEALALSEEALRLDPTNEEASRYVRFFQAAQHLNQALSLGEAGRLDEAAAEVAEAKKDYPSHTKIPEIEQWISQLKQQREAAVNAANQKAAEDKAAEARAREAAANAAERKAADQRAAEDRAAEARAREAAAKAAADEKKRQEPPELAGTSWSGEATLAAAESWTMPLTMSIDGDNQISGEVILIVPDVEERKKLPLQGTYNPQTGAIKMEFKFAEEGFSMRGTLVGTVISSSSAGGQVSAVIEIPGMENTTAKGTWRISRK